MQQSGSYRSASIVVPLIRTLIPVKSVCDVGCGAGTWLRCWRENGIEDVLGIDGDYVDRTQLAIPAANFQAADLRHPIHSTRCFDLVMSLEVAEHLPQERAESFVADLTALAPVVLFSAAVPGQAGTGHINERWQSYWADLFDQAGYAAFDVVRPGIWDDEGVEFWYRQNTLLFCRCDAIAGYPALMAAAATMPLAVVHPALLAASLEPLKTLNTRQALFALRTALSRAFARRIDRWRPMAATRARS
jgi:hypothetical protein